MKGIHRWPVDSSSKGSVMWKAFPWRYVVMCCWLFTPYTILVILLATDIVLVSFGNGRPESFIADMITYPDPFSIFSRTSYLPMGNAIVSHVILNTLRPRQNCCHFFRRHFHMHFSQWIWKVSINISLKFVPKGPINSISALVEIMAWRRPGDKPLSEPMMMDSLLRSMS